MAITVTFDFEPEQVVYVIEMIECETQTNKSGLTVQRGTVKRVFTEALINSTAADNIRYDVRIDGRSGTKEFKAEDVFADKTSAITEYETRVD